MAKLTPEELNELISVYVGYFNRAPDPKGLQYYIYKLEAEPPTTDITTIANNFANSPEALGQYPYLATPGLSSTTAFITSIYKNLFNREPDDAGLAYWEDKLDTGVRTPGEMILAIIKGAVGGDDKAIIDNKIAAALDFVTDAASTPGFVYDDAAHQQAKDTLSNITADAQSVTDAGAAADAFLAGATGVTYTLTAGPDARTGGAGNDIFTALPIDADGDATTTFSAFDNLDGGAGQDTLNVYVETQVNAGIPSTSTVKNIEIINIFDEKADGEDGDFGQIDASKFEGATQIWQIGAKNGVINLADSTTAGFRDLDSRSNSNPLSVNAAAAAESVNIVLDDVRANEWGANVHVDVSGAALNTVNINGTIVPANDPETDDAPTLDLEIIAGKGVKTVVLSTDIDTELAKLENASNTTVTTLDASASTGGIVIDGEGTLGLETVTTGSGDDTVVLVNDLDSDEQSTVSTGEGNDTIDLSYTDGELVIDAGAGDDVVKIDNKTLLASDAVDGGEGDDVLEANLGPNPSDDQLIVMRNVVSNFETLLTSGDVNELDVSTLNQTFDNIAFADGAGTVTDVTTETIIAVNGADLDVTADGFDLSPTAPSFGGDLTITANADDFTGGGDDTGAPFVLASTISADGDNVSLNVVTENTTEDRSASNDSAGLLAVRLAGDMKTAAINLVSSVNTAPRAGESDSNNVALVTFNAQETSSSSEIGKGLESVTVTGNGIAFVQNETGSKLATTDASGLASTHLVGYTYDPVDFALLFQDPTENAVVSSIYADTYDAGDLSFGLIYASDNDGLTETVTLSDGVDLVTLSAASTFAKTDVITGLNLVTDDEGNLTNQSDFLTVDAGTLYSKLTAGQLADLDAAGTANLELYLTKVAKLDTDSVVFQFEGDTYVYNDNGLNADLLDNADGLVKLTGGIDLDDLLVSLNHTAPSA